MRWPWSRKANPSEQPQRPKRETTDELIARLEAHDDGCDEPHDCRYIRACTLIRMAKVLDQHEGRETDAATLRALVEIVDAATSEAKESEQ